MRTDFKWIAETEKAPFNEDAAVYRQLCVCVCQRTLSISFWKETRWDWLIRNDWTMSTPCIHCIVYTGYNFVRLRKSKLDLKKRFEKTDLEHRFKQNRHYINNVDSTWRPSQIYINFIYGIHVWFLVNLII